MIKEVEQFFTGTEAIVNVKYEMFINLLKDMLPVYRPSLRPAPNSETFDSYFNKTLTYETWGKIYGQWAEYVCDEKTLEIHIREALDRKERLLR